MFFHFRPQKTLSRPWLSYLIFKTLLRTGVKRISIALQSLSQSLQLKHISNYTYNNMGIECAPKPHVAFLASPGIGHITPLFELAYRLVTQHDFQVTFLVIANNSTLVQTQYLNANSHPDLHILHLPHADTSGLLSDDMTPLTRLCVITEASIRPLRSVLLGLHKLKALVIDVFCTGVFEVCKELCIQVYSFFTSSAAFLAFSFYLPMVDKEVKGKVVDLPHSEFKVPGCYPIKTHELMGLAHVDEYKWFLHHVSRCLHGLDYLFREQMLEWFRHFASEWLSIILSLDD
ncbi:hypothetical protein QVD17_39253 [Tagetes erecta]|uniref:Uncharacterized protein n=1 Tax=Tagetes erecta TaxID=13708 RepID=A0AAD8JN85_TARER|nr:hypothetical protein QVD17_39253 [Tagetes erecta]